MYIHFLRFLGRLGLWSGHIGGRAGESELSPKGLRRLPHILIGHQREDIGGSARRQLPLDSA
jgi:hypothetical protein